MTESPGRPKRKDTLNKTEIVESSESKRVSPNKRGWRKSFDSKNSSKIRDTDQDDKQGSDDRSASPNIRKIYPTSPSPSPSLSPNLSPTPSASFTPTGVSLRDETPIDSPVESTNHSMVSPSLSSDNLPRIIVAEGPDSSSSRSENNYEEPEIIIETETETKEATDSILVKTEKIKKEKDVKEKDIENGEEKNTVKSKLGGKADSDEKKTEIRKSERGERKHRKSLEKKRPVRFSDEPGVSTPTGVISPSPPQDRSPKNSPKQSAESSSSEDEKKSGGDQVKKEKKPSKQGHLLSGMFGILAGSKKTQDDKKKKPLAAQSHYVAGNFKQLPSKALNLINDSKISKKDLEPFFYELLMVLSFITKDSFRLESDVQIIKRSEKTRYASREFQLKSEAAMKPSNEKEIKKIYKHIEFSAKGGFGRVFSAKQSTKKGLITVAIKRLPNVSEKEIRANLCELSFLLNCTNHPNIVNYIESYKMGNEIWIVTEFLEGGTLDFASRVHRFREKHIVFIAGEILNGLSYLHSQNFAHRDLKPSNVMMSIHGEIKIIDFGLCCDFHNGPRQQTLGSPFWIPPEMLLRKPHTNSVDIWSFSILLLELVVGRTPLFGSKLASMMYSIMGRTLTEALKEPSHRTLREPSQNLTDFLKVCVVSDQDKRPTAKSLLEEPWLQNHKDSKDGIEKVLHAVFISSSLQQHGMV